MPRYRNLGKIKMPQSAGINLDMRTIREEIDRGFLKPHKVVLYVKMLRCTNNTQIVRTKYGRDLALRFFRVGGAKPRVGG
ncbi:hypothetical protein C7416_106231 [Cupriavidus phytorum]|uniref:Uncharacterized protein n=1 Tax=Cupriavidus phytorum TaxID=3024399 RepID=A0A2W7NXV5_9BURK|nr:hypothetical protein C7416_106231 [Cupriavidus alkaliphilus]